MGRASFSFSVGEKGREGDKASASLVSTLSAETIR